MLVAIGGVYSVHVKVPPDTDSLPKRLDLMGCWPTVYDAGMVPSDMSDYSVVVFCAGERTSVTEVLDLMRPYGATSARWLTEFYKAV